MTDSSHDRYSSPLAGRYASQAMLALWSQQERHGLWRRLWLALAEAERELGVDIPEEALAQMRAHVDDIDFAAAAEYERRFRHDVMAHVHAFADVAPAARPYIHLGATSAYVTDNADLIIMRRALAFLRDKVGAALAALAAFACSSPAPTTPAAPAPGAVRGVVTDLAVAGPPTGGPGSEAYLLPGPDAPRTEAVRRAPVTGGPRSFEFALDSVPPGRYYLQACLEVGRGRACAPYTHQLGGQPAPIDVRAGAVTTIAVLF